MTFSNLAAAVQSAMIKAYKSLDFVNGTTAYAYEDFTLLYVLSICNFLFCQNSYVIFMLLSHM